MVNAARHSGAPSVDVYAECADDAVEVFVRDRGTGFDPDDVPEDRMGLRGSVIGRMERHGGTARDPLRAGRGHRGGADHGQDASARTGDRQRRKCSRSDRTDGGGRERAVRAGSASCWSTTTRCSAAGCGPSSATRSTSSARPRTSTSAVAAVLREAPDVVLLDVHLPGRRRRRGADPGRRRRARRPGSWRCRSPTPPQDVIGVIRAGARGYVTKTITGPELVAGDRAGRRRATRCSARGWPGSCSTRSPDRRGAVRRPRARPAVRRASAR